MDYNQEKNKDVENSGEKLLISLFSIKNFKSLDDNITYNISVSTQINGHTIAKCKLQTQNANSEEDRNWKSIQKTAKIKRYLIDFDALV